MTLPPTADWPPLAVGMRIVSETGKIKGVLQVPRKRRGQARREGFDILLDADCSLTGTAYVLRGYYTAKSLKEMHCTLVTEGEEK